jgi:hypothetical protein
MIKRKQKRRAWTRLAAIRFPCRAGLCLVLMLLLAACREPSSTQQTYAVGQTAEVDGWKITVHGLYLLVGDQWHQPADGHVFCAVELTVENASGRIRYVMPEKQMHLLDAADHAFSIGHEAGLMAARSRQWYVPQGEVGIEKVLHGAAAYEIPAGSQGLRWTFVSGLVPWSKTVVFALGELPQQ